MIALTIVLTVLTVRRNSLYATDLRIWTDFIEKRPNNARAWNNVGAAYEIRGQIDEAMRHYRRALTSEPAHTGALRNLVRILTANGREEEVAGLILAGFAARPPRSADEHMAYATLLERMGRIAEAVEQHRLALKIQPDRADARAALDRLGPSTTRPAATTTTTTTRSFE